MAQSPRSMPIGHRIRARRLELGLRQRDLAESLGISPSYLNMIEHNRRIIAGSLLIRLAEALGVDMASLSGTEEIRLLSQLTELAADPMLQATPFNADEAARLVAQAPAAARTLLTLYRGYRASNATVDALRDSLAEDPLLAEASHQILTLITSIRAFSEILSDYDDLPEFDRRRYLTAMAEESRRLTDSTRELFAVANGRTIRNRHPSAVQEAEDFVQDNGNYFAELEGAMDGLRQGGLDRPPCSLDRLADWLRHRHAITLETVAPDTLHGWSERLEPGRLLLSEVLPPTTQRFLAARHVARLTAAEIVEGLLSGQNFSSESAPEMSRSVLLSYAAGALLFPYEPFLAAAEELHYDVERLQARFQGSFEQICHRLSTLRRPGAEGIAFHFLRRDAAGNLSKRFSASGLRLPHYGGACPRWIIHSAFQTPGRLVTQLARMPDDNRYLFLARTVSGPAQDGVPARMQAVLVGCSLAAAARTVYAERHSREGGGGEVPVGVTCALCPRLDCDQRATPWLEAERIGAVGQGPS